MNIHTPKFPDPGMPPAEDSSHGQTWFVAQLKPNGFAKAKTNLERQGFKTFMPLIERTVSHARKKKRVMRALFPGYIFVSFDARDTQWRSINSTFGVSSLIMARANSPARVPVSLMAALLAGCDHRGHVLPPDSFIIGDKVRITSGAFRGTLAKVQFASDGDRVRLLLNIMGRSVSADCSCSELEILSA